MKRTTAEVHAVLNHILGCVPCAMKALKREEQSEFIEKNFMTKEEIDEVENEVENDVKKVITKILLDKELSGERPENTQTNQVRRWL